MNDRISLYPGRVTLTPVAGQANTYDLVRADSPTQEGTPLNKASLLKDTTAALYGLTASAVPDDIFRFLNHLVPCGKGLLSIRVVDGSGAPASRALTVSPAIDGETSVTTDAAGFFRTAVPPGTYTFSTGASSLFETVTPASVALTVAVGKAVSGEFIVAAKLSGEVDLTTSQTVIIPAWLTSCDLFVVGGGGSGAAGGSGNILSGGGGGYTSTLKNQNLAGKTLSIQIGAGGAATTHTRAGSGTSGNSGGSTSILANESVILTAAGGVRGHYRTPSTDTFHPADGGSGGGAGSDEAIGGTDGGNGGGPYGGAGQGTTTRKFSEAGNTLYSGGGGGAYLSTSEAYLASAGGAGGGGNAVVNPRGTTSSAGNATFYGGGGGAACAYVPYSTSNAYTIVSGAGYQGLASIRWNLEG